jgi:RNA recognition motif-containing protein
VGGLPDKGFYDLDLQQFFNLAGFKVVSATVAADPKSLYRKSLGYGYVAFADENEMLRCLAEMNNKPLGDRTISLSRQVDSKNFDPKANVFVRNIDRSVT